MKVFSHGSIPATLTGQIATNKEYRSSGIGTLMVSPAIDAASHLSEKIGCRVAALRPHGDSIGWHQKQAFEIIRREKKQDHAFWHSEEGIQRPAGCIVLVMPEGDLA